MIEITTGSILFITGIGGMALCLVVGIVAAVCLRNSKKKLQRRLDEVYKV